MKLLITSLCLLMSFSIAAQDMAKKDHPCIDDIKKFCSGVEHGHGQMAKCLKEHEKELSPECSAKKEEMKEKRHERVKDFVANCKEDAQKLCKDVPRGHGAKMNCLKEKKDQLSEKCKAVLP